MGVINMAHGELMMIGAYTTYVVQNLFAAICRACSTGYVLAAIPAAFLVFGAGRRAARARRDPLPLRPPARDVARRLGHQPGLQQAVRSLFGAQNVPSKTRAGSHGGVAVMSNLVLPYNRIGDHRLRLRSSSRGVALLIARTRFGLFIRGGDAEPAHGIVRRRRHGPDRHVAFSFGAGIAGLGGVALSQIGKSGPISARAISSTRSWSSSSAASASSPGTVVAGARPGASSTSCSRPSPARCWPRSRCPSSSSSSSKEALGLLGWKGRSAEP